MLSDSSILNRKDTLIILTYAIAGFGHLRVTDALYHEIKDNSNTVFFNTDNKIITYFHETISLHPAARAVFEWAQSGKPEDTYTFLFRTLLKKDSNRLLKRFISVLNQAKKPLRTVIVVATHFLLAHQIAQIRDKIEKEGKVRLFLFVQVTDDSPQHIWYVPGVDLTFAPSEYTKKGLLDYGKKARLAPIKVKVIPYPVSETLTQKLTNERNKYKLSQFMPDSTDKIKIMVPISGAAVGMDYFIDFAESLFKQSQRFNLHILLKKTPYTQFFIKKLRNYNLIDLNYFKKDTKVVDEYENKYKRVTFGYEITKPSEQAFKALIKVSSIGGPILLFTNPVGRQEYDNLNFLGRHHLIPSINDQKYLWEASLKDLSLDNLEGKEILKRASLWRGILLFKDPKKSVTLMLWCLEQGIFKEMGNCMIEHKREDAHSEEIMPDGASKFWQNIDIYLKDNKKI